MVLGTTRECEQGQRHLDSAECLSQRSNHHLCSMNALNEQLTDCWIASSAKIFSLLRIYEKIAGEVT